MMKYTLFIPFLFSFFIFSCSEEDVQLLDVSITGLEDVSLKSGEEKTIPLNVSFNNDVEGSIALALANVPAGIQCELSKTTGTETFTTNLVISITNEAEAGEYEIDLTGTTNDGGTDINQTFTLEVIKELSVSFKVYDASSWSKEDPSFEVVEGAKVTFYYGEEEIVATTNEEGIAEIYNLEDGDYYFIVETETMSNVVYQEELEGNTYGYLVDGVYESQSQIDESPEPNASVGDIKLVDLNGDFIINSDDRTQSKWLGYEVVDGPMTLTIYIANKNP